ncbi:MAG: pyruvate kinase [Lachnospiraceae bacterium]|nr:pyruvate kinase [Lachnospiraceae bacterium]MBQ5660252.1 pyruvate kinase [Lachnospiraceae bacterium]
MNKKTKIICTMGPNSDNREIMKQLVLNGMDVARFNFSHGTHDEQRARYLQLREVAEECGVPIAALLDTKGPEIRTCTLKDGKKVTLKEGQEFILTTEELIGDENMVQINYDGLNEDVAEGNRILIDDGLIELHVKYVDGPKIYCTVINGGELGERKGVNVPGVKIKLPALTDKDKEDIRFGMEMGFDYVAASFIRSADAIQEIREILKEGNSSMGIIAKIENEEGLDNLDAIIEASDGIMVARGDLGVEVAPEKLPYLQKMMIEKCSQACKIVITATQMLDSMIRNPRPTRAEVTDVANAVYDGTDVVMLSGETANGKYPVEALKMMVQIVTEAESHLGDTFYKVRRVGETSSHDISNAVCYASVTTARALEAKVILSPTISGYTARMLSKWHPAPRIICVSANQESVRRMQLYWGVTPLLGAWAENIDDKIMHAIDVLKEKEIVDEGDLVVVTAGTLGHSRKNEPATATNGMRVVVVD